MWWISYIIFAVVLVIIVGGGILLRMKKIGPDKRKYQEACILGVEKEYGERTDSNGNVHKGVTGMKIVFGFRDGKQKYFEIDTKYRSIGKPAVNDWGNIMYEGDKLLKFECPSGAIGTKMYVQKSDSVFNKFK